MTPNNINMWPHLEDAHIPCIEGEVMSRGHSGSWKRDEERKVSLMPFGHQ